MKITRGKKILLVITILIFYVFFFYIPSNLKGYYDNLVQKQHCLNIEDINNQRLYIRAIAEGVEPYMKYYFEINDTYYYVLRDIVYSLEGEKIVELLPKSEGYFTHEDNLYYVYGEEINRDLLTMAGTIGFTFKKYRFSKLSMSSLTDERISKREYEKRYSEVRKIINGSVNQ